MLKKVAFILGGIAGVFIVQQLIVWMSVVLPLFVLPMIALIFPLLCIGYGFFAYKEIKYCSCAVVAIAALIFCFQKIDLSSVIWSVYYTFMCLFGILIHKKVAKNI